MIILFKPDKSLIISKPSRILQNENCADVIVFYCNKFYEDVDLSTATASFSYYQEEVNIAHVDILVQEESDKEGFLKYKLPVTSELTKFAGNVTGHMTFANVDQADEEYIIVESKDVTFPISTFEDYFRFAPPESFNDINRTLSDIDNKIKQLQHVAGELDLDMPTDLMLTDDLLQLRSDNGPIGEGQHILINPQDPDPQHDGEVDVDNVLTEIDLDALNNNGG